MTQPLHVSTAIGNAKWGVKGGLRAAVVYCLWVGLLFLIGGPETFSRLGVTLTTVMATYVTVGVLAGAVIGLLRPLTGNGFGAFVVGYLAAVPITAGIMICLKGWPSTWTIGLWHSFPMLVLIFGTMVGYELDRRADELRARPDSKSRQPRVRHTIGNADT
jgi:hypothetical protein